MKKYVTWAYFSVSATWNWRQPASRERCGQRRAVSGGKATSDRQAGLVLGHGDDEQAIGAGRPSGAVRSKPSKSGVGEGVGQLAGPVGPEVRVDDGVAVADAAVDAVDDGRA